METTVETTLTVNGDAVTRRIPARQHLIDFLREELGLTGSHIGCEHGVCGACTVRVDGRIVRGCLMLAVQADGRTVDTIEGLSDSGELAELQHEFHRTQRAAMRFLHARHAARRAGPRRCTSPARRASRSASTCRATTAAAPATRRSSTRSRPCSSPAAEAVTHIGHGITRKRELKRKTRPRNHTETHGSRKSVAIECRRTTTGRSPMYLMIPCCWLGTFPCASVCFRG